MKKVRRMIIISFSAIIVVLLAASHHLHTRDRATVQGFPCRYTFSQEAWNLTERSLEGIQLGEPAADAVEKLGAPSGEFRANYMTEAYYQIGWNRYAVLLFAPSKETGELLVTRVYLANAKRVLRVVKGYDKAGLYDAETPFVKISTTLAGSVDGAAIESVRTLEELERLLGQRSPVRQARVYCDYTAVILDKTLYYFLFRADGGNQTTTEFYSMMKYPCGLPEPQIQILLYDQTWPQDYPEELLAAKQ